MIEKCFVKVSNPVHMNINHHKYEFFLFELGALFFFCLMEQRNDYIQSPLLVKEIQSKEVSVTEQNAMRWSKWPSNTREKFRK